MATIKDVAEQAGVSVATVSHVINNTRFVSNEVIDKVNRAIQKLKYKPNAVARSLRRKETKTLGLIISTNLSPYYAEVLQGIQDACFEFGYSAIVCYSNENQEDEIYHIDMLTKRGVDGIIIDSVSLNQIIINALKDIDIPVIMLNRHLKELNVDSIASDDFSGAYASTKYLIELGHKKIACVTGYCCDTHSVYRRYFGYEKAMREAGIEIKKEYIMESDYTLKAGCESFKKLMNLNVRPTAIIFNSDVSAIAALHTAYKMKIRVPDDISLIGYDDIAFASYSIPPLTTVFQEKYSMGKKSVKRLLKRINDKKLKPEKIVLTPELIIRESCGAVT